MISTDTGVPGMWDCLSWQCSFSLVEARAANVTYLLRVEPARKISLLKFMVKTLLKALAL